MKKNRLLSAFLAGALMVSAMPFQAFAAPTSDITNPTPGGGTIEGDSTVVSQAEVRVVVPADTDFLVNPLELDVAGVSDQIISTPFTFINKSNMDVQLSVSPEFTSDSGITVASSPDEIKNTIGEAPTIFLQVAPATTKPTLKGAGDTLEFDNATTPTFTSGDGISTTVTEEADGVTPNATYFKLQNLKKAYSVNTAASGGPKMEYDKSKATPADTDAVALKFIGKVSQMSTWTGIAPKVRFHYEFNLISKDAYADSSNEVAGAHGLVNKDLTVTGPAITLTPGGKFAFVNIPEGYGLNGFGYIASPKDGTATITVTEAEVKEAILNADGGPKLKGVTVGSYTIGSMTANDFDYDGDTRTGSLKTGPMNGMNGRAFMICSFITDKSEGGTGEPIAVVSPAVVIDNTATN